MEFEDIKAYKERLEKGYLEQLEYKKGILNQIDIEEKKLKETKDKVYSEEKELDNKKRESNFFLEQFKKNKADFIKLLDDRQIDIDKKSEWLETFSHTLSLKEKDLEITEKGLSNFSDKMDLKNRELVERELSQNQKIEEVKRMQTEARKILESNEKDKNIIERIRIELLNKEKSMLTEINEVNIVKDFLAKEKESLARENDILNKEKGHINSQQIALKLAYKELKELQENYANKNR